MCIYVFIASILRSAKAYMYGIVLCAYRLLHPHSESANAYMAVLKVTLTSPSMKIGERVRDNFMCAYCFCPHPQLKSAKAFMAALCTLCALCLHPHTNVSCPSLLMFRKGNPSQLSIRQKHNRKGKPISRRRINTSLTCRR